MEIRITEDGSRTIYLPEIGESYHSQYGAVNESMHVFIEAGFHHRAQSLQKMKILEVGLGTGLNLLLTFSAAGKLKIPVDYVALEPFPIAPAMIDELNYNSLPGMDHEGGLMSKVHGDKWEEEIELSNGFNMTKFKLKLEEYEPSGTLFDLVYFDAFSPAVQPELWSQEIFDKIASLASPGCILVTYSAKGQVRRNMQQAGFTVERLPGPKGKREMLRGTKESFEV